MVNCWKLRDEKKSSLPSFEGLNVSGTTWHGGGHQGQYQIPLLKKQSRSCVHCLGARQETPAVRWRSLLKNKPIWCGLGKRLTSVLLILWYRWFIAVWSYPPPPALSFFLAHTGTGTLGLCQTFGLEMPHHPGGTVEIDGMVFMVKWTCTSRLSLKAFDQNHCSKLLNIYSQATKKSQLNRSPMGIYSVSVFV